MTDQPTVTPEVEDETVPTPDETVTPEEAAEIEAADSDEDETEDEELPPPDLSILAPGLQAVGNAMVGAAEIARAGYLKDWGILEAAGDPAKLLAAKRESSENPDVVALVTQAAELQAQIDSVISQADEILRESGEVDVMSDEDRAAVRESLAAFKSAYLDSIKYGEDHVVEGFGRLFEDLPGMRKRRAKAEGGQDYTMTTSLKPKTSEITVNGTDVRNDNGRATFTYLSQYLKRQSGKTVQVGDLHAAWLEAAGTKNVSEIKDAVFFDFTSGDNTYQIKIVPDEAA